jgi:uncharacterized protein (TIGR02594 family)
MTLARPDNMSSPYTLPWLERARHYLGVKEKPGASHTAAILGFFAKAGHGWVKTDEVPWCAAFVNAVLKETGLPGTGKLTARSFLQWGEPISEPRKGAIAVFRRGQSSWQGHVGFVMSSDAHSILLLGGNQSNRVSLAPYSRKRLLGCRWPDKAMLKTVQAPPSSGPQRPEVLGRVTAHHLNLRDKPKRLGGTIIGVLQKGETLSLHEHWYHVTAGGKSGWVSGQYVEADQ